MIADADYWIGQLSRPLRKDYFGELLAEPEITPDVCTTLYALTRHDNKTIAWRALWGCEMLCRCRKGDFTAYRADLSARLQSEKHSGMKRLMLSMLYVMPPVEPPDMLLFDFCLERMFAPAEAIAVQCLCQKLAYRTASFVPQFRRELKETLLFGNLDSYAPAVRCSARNILKKLTQKNNKKDNYDVFR